MAIQAVVDLLHTKLRSGPTPRPSWNRPSPPSVVSHRTDPLLECSNENPSTPRQNLSMANAPTRLSCLRTAEWVWLPHSLGYSSTTTSFSVLLSHVWFAS